ncbi:MaoC family dehydratase [Streptacidiphilus sp. 4-A2]|nr:MaoC family dehydratase [Streptacidiphilus sp. 4-A2]
MTEPTTERAEEAERAEPAGRAELPERVFQEYAGQPAAADGRALDPVNVPMIRHWCEAVGDTNPAYAGPGAVAPPAMLQVWTMAGLSGGADSRSGPTSGCWINSTPSAARRWSPPTASSAICARCGPVSGCCSKR